MEAMATGLPVVAVNAMALPELVKNGENGYLFDLADSENLSNILIELFSNSGLRRQMGKKSLEIIQEHDINKSMAMFESIYQSMLDSSDES